MQIRLLQTTTHWGLPIQTCLFVHVSIQEKAENYYKEAILLVTGVWAKLPFHFQLIKSSFTPICLLVQRWVVLFHLLKPILQLFVISRPNYFRDNTNFLISESHLNFQVIHASVQKITLKSPALFLKGFEHKCIKHHFGWGDNRHRAAHRSEVMQILNQLFYIIFLSYSYRKCNFKTFHFSHFQAKTRSLGVTGVFFYI